MITQLRRVFRTSGMSSSLLFRRAIRRFAILALSAALLSATCSAVVFASPINLGDFMGNTVSYLNVQEDSNSGDPPGLFGAASVSADSLDFNPVGFNAAATGGTDPLDTDQTDGQLLFMVKAKPQKVINNFRMKEFGDTTLSGAGVTGAFTSVSTSVFIDIVEINSIPVNAIHLQKDMVFTPSGGTFIFNGGPTLHSQWMGQLDVDLNQELANLHLTGQVTKININLDNTLAAGTLAGASALIAKKDATGVIITANFPEPASCVLALIGLVGTGLFVRRRTA